MRMRLGGRSRHVVCWSGLKRSGSFEQGWQMNSQGVGPRRVLCLQGVVRGRRVRRTVPGPAAACPLDQAVRQFKAECPNRLWVADFTYVATWGCFVHVASVIDVFARRIVGWRVSRSARSDFVLDVLEQALHESCPFTGSSSCVTRTADRGT